MATGFYHDKTFNLKRLMIASSTGPQSSIDVTNLLIELSVFEDLYTSTISGEVSLSDSMDIITIVPIIGFEYLVLVFGKPNTEEETSKVFRIYKIDRVAVNFSTQSSQVYSIRFCSEEQIVSSARSVLKSYKGKVVSDIISDILKGQLKVDAKKIARVEPTTAVYDLIVPNLSPFKALQWVTSRTKPPSVFFENNKGFNFVSLSTLFKQQTKAQYSFSPQNILEDNTRNVIKYEFMNMFDTLQATTGGMFSGNLTTIDLVRWRVESQKFNYKTEFDKGVHTEKKAGSFYNDHQDRFNKMAVENDQAFIRYYPTTKDHNTHKNITTKQPGLNQNQVEQWMLQRASAIEQLNYLKLKLVVTGDVTLTVGDIIEFGVPLITTKVPGKLNINPFTSGRYLITALRHKIDLFKYETIIEATKESLADELPKATNGQRTKTQ